MVGKVPDNKTTNDIDGNSVGNPDDNSVNKTDQADETPSTAFDAKEYLKTLTSRPGVYRMLDANGGVLYVGKAKNLKKRVASYFHRSGLAPKTRALVAQIRGVEVTVTHTEGEALLLENNLIKDLKPRYNILLRDDKSYPYIFLSDTKAYPRLSYHRGAKRAKGRYFGPYPSAGSVRESLSLLQKLFRVRQCDDSFFSNRTRPCLQYQIKRCTGPCVGLISEAQYREDVRRTTLFLEGKSSTVINELVAQMEQAAEAQAFEEAAQHRDLIANLRRVQESQYVTGEGGDLDVIAAVTGGGLACVQVFFVRDGRNLGNKSFFPRHTDGAEADEVLSAFIAQYYLVGHAGRTVPSEILINHALDDRALLESVLADESGRKVQISHKLRGERSRWVEMAVTNAENSLNTQIATKSTVLRRFDALQEVLQLDSPPQRLECFDISHTMGEATVASCVVLDTTGPVKSDYRRFNIEGIIPGDDYAAMHQALLRRYTRLKKGEGKLPDILFIDGGKGQLSEAEAVMEELQITGVTLIGVSKGPSRRPGQEQLILASTQTPRVLPADSPALHLIQQIRDEAHRFAITGHRQRRAKARTTSILEGIDGLGPKRRQTLLKQFGGLQEVARAGVEDLARVPGISKQLAQRVYDVLHVED
ncbi:MAG: excinuclease ABC subunit UvrC [Ectothiorhodospiraceae bacterium]|nr:excinuclease ABC subunit UvrC [Ectothiorhodospiraceae bacterium]